MKKNDTRTDPKPDTLDLLIEQNLNTTLKGSLAHWTIIIGYSALLVVTLLVIGLVICGNLPSGDPVKIALTSLTIFSAFGTASVCIRRLKLEQHDYRYTRLLLLQVLVEADLNQTAQARRRRVKALAAYQQELKTLAPKNTEPEQRYKAAVEYLLDKLTSFTGNKPKND